MSCDYEKNIEYVAIVIDKTDKVLDKMSLSEAKSISKIAAKKVNREENPESENDNIESQALSRNELSHMSKDICAHATNIDDDERQTELESRSRAFLGGGIESCI